MANSNSLTCFGVNGSAPRLYYLSDPKPPRQRTGLEQRVGQRRHDGERHRPTRTRGAAAGSALACFGVNGSATRLYYLDGNSQVNELAWNNNAWVNTNITANVTHPPAPARPPPAAPWPASE